MTQWGSRMMLGALVSATLIFAVGCEEKELKLKNQQLESANTKMRNDNLALANENSRIKGDYDNMLAQAQAKDKTIADLQAMLKAPPAPPPPPPGGDQGQGGAKPPAKRPVRGATGFEGGDVEEGAGVITVTLASDLLFDSGKATLKPSALPSLARIAAVIKSKYAGHRIRVVGHTDSDPIKKSGWKDNWDLSFNRAHAVGSYLIEKGVSAKKVEMSGVADTEPRGKDKARNRRVQIQVIGG